MSAELEVCKAIPSNQISPKMTKKNGFTLIELLIVIVIIGILATLAIVAYNASQQKGRDVKRKSDLDSFKKALEMYKSDTKQASYYPKEGASAASCDGGGTGPCVPLTAMIQQDTDPKYVFIKKIPKDPSTKKDYYYKASKSDGTDCTTPTTNAPADAVNCTTYKMIACLENPSDPQKDTTIDATACGTWTGSSYTVTNP